MGRPSPPRGAARLVVAGVLLLAVVPGKQSSAQQGGVAGTLHNLSASGPGEIRAVSETEICKFCHIPHNAVVPEPLWSHELSRAQYAVPRVRDGAGGFRAVPQPDGSSRLCLSCHDGTVALGEIGGEPSPVAMTGGRRLTEGRKGYLGTDLSGSHPISFVVPDGGLGFDGAERDIGLKPLVEIRSDPAVRLDQNGKMQCTTCHDPHSDLYYDEGRVPRFWVKATVSEVCVTCHVLR